MVIGEELNTKLDHSMYLALFSRNIVALLLASMNSSVMSLKRKCTSSGKIGSSISTQEKNKIYLMSSLTIFDLPQILA